MDRTGRTVIVTGGAPGIGHATALLDAPRGASVVTRGIGGECGWAAAEEERQPGFAPPFLSLDLMIGGAIDAFAAVPDREAEAFNGLVRPLAAMRRGSGGSRPSDNRDDPGPHSGALSRISWMASQPAKLIARYRIGANCVYRHPTDTPLSRCRPERMKALTRIIPFRRIAQQIEIAEAVLLFLGDRASCIMGQAVSVSGGLTEAG